MSNFYAAQSVGVDDGTKPFIPGDGAYRGGAVRALIASFDLGAQLVSVADTIDWGGLPKGAVPMMAFLDTNRSLGSSTVDLGFKVGATLTAAQFKAAGTFTATDTPTPFMKGAACGVALTAAGRVVTTVAAANMPNNSGDRLTLIFLYTMPHGD